MDRHAVRFRILRSRPGRREPAWFESFPLELGPRATVLDGLEIIRREQDASLMYRHSCHHASCGTCACKINGTERLACVTPVRDLGTPEVVLEPLDGFPCLGDLVVDTTRLHRDMPADRSMLRASEIHAGAELPEGIRRRERFENCIECGACVSSCPVVREGGASFRGPAGLAALNREAANRPERAPRLLEEAGREGGARRCDRALNCSRVCPTGVYPARHIQDLIRALDADDGKGSR